MISIVGGCSFNTTAPSLRSSATANDSQIISNLDGGLVESADFSAVGNDANNLVNDANLSATDMGLTDILVRLDLSACGGMTCPNGCNETAKRCNYLWPSNVTQTVMQDVLNKEVNQQITGSIVSCSDWIYINSDDGSIQSNQQLVTRKGSTELDQGIYWKIIDQGKDSQNRAYPQLSLLVMRSFNIPSGCSIYVQGSKALAIYTLDQIIINANAIIYAHSPTAFKVGPTSGAGGFSGGWSQSDGVECFGGQGKAGKEDDGDQSGGGGGGRGAVGGTGGVGNDAIGGLPGYGNGNVNLVPIYGGCGGGGGGGSLYGGKGGGGGGAISLSANDSMIIMGSITAPGAGGVGGTTGQGGGGGGSGGAILLESRNINIQSSALIAANGGSGGAGSPGANDSTTCNSGFPGPLSTYYAIGGAASGYGAAGGSGGCLSQPAGSNGEGDYNAGGGGGSVGRIRINCTEYTLDQAKPHFSPAPSTAQGAMNYF